MCQTCFLLICTFVLIRNTVLECLVYDIVPIMMFLFSIFFQFRCWHLRVVPLKRNKLFRNLILILGTCLKCPKMKLIIWHFLIWLWARHAVTSTPSRRFWAHHGLCRLDFDWRGSWNERISVCTIQMKMVLADVPNKWNW